MVYVNSFFDSESLIYNYYVGIHTAKRRAWHHFIFIVNDSPQPHLCSNRAEMHITFFNLYDFGLTSCLRITCSEPLPLPYRSGISTVWISPSGLGVRRTQPPSLASWPRQLWGRGIDWTEYHGEFWFAAPLPGPDADRARPWRHPPRRPQGEFYMSCWSW